VALADGLAIHALLDEDVMRQVCSSDDIAAQWLAGYSADHEKSLRQ
jgi:hypothetical protein